MSNVETLKKERDEAVSKLKEFEDSFATCFIPMWGDGKPDFDEIEQKLNRLESIRKICSKHNLTDSYEEIDAETINEALEKGCADAQELKEVMCWVTERIKEHGNENNQLDSDDVLDDRLYTLQEILDTKLVTQDLKLETKKRKHDKEENKSEKRQKLFSDGNQLVPENTNWKRKYNNLVAEACLRSEMCPCERGQCIPSISGTCNTCKIDYGPCCISFSFKKFEGKLYCIECFDKYKCFKCKDTHKVGFMTCTCSK
jgi:hypothetical protein